MWPAWCLVPETKHKRGCYEQLRNKPEHKINLPQHYGVDKCVADTTHVTMPELNQSQSEEMKKDNLSSPFSHQDHCLKIIHYEEPLFIQNCSFKTSHLLFKGEKGEYAVYTFSCANFILQFQKEKKDLSKGMAILLNSSKNSTTWQ